MQPRSASGYLEVSSAQMRQRDCHAAAIMQVLGELRFNFRLFLRHHQSNSFSFGDLVEAILFPAIPEARFRIDAFRP
jgi:hypothetical protein